VRVHNWKSPEGNQHSTAVVVAEWSVTATASNGVALVRRPGEPGKSHYITYVGGSYSASVVGGEMLLKDGNALVGDYFVHDQRGVPLTFPLRMAEGNEVSLALAAGGLGVRGACTLQGYTA
jgi:hypothetical protein